MVLKGTVKVDANNIRVVNSALADKMSKALTMKGMHNVIKFFICVHFMNLAAEYNQEIDTIYVDIEAHLKDLKEQQF